MLDDGDRRRERILIAREPALRAVFGVLQRVLVGSQIEGDRTGADRDPRLVHHVKHLAHAVVRCSDEIPHAVARRTERQHGVDHAALPELVIDAGDDRVVARAAFAVFIDEILRHDEKRDAFDPGRSARQFREHEVDDIFAQVVLGGRNPHLAAREAIAAVTGGHGPGCDVRKRGARLRFRERHRPEIAAFEHRGHPTLLLLVAAEGGQEICGADGQERVRIRAAVRGGKHEAGGGPHRRGQL